MIGLEYILNLYGVQHQVLAEKLGIRKQNINLWIKGKQNISKKYLPILSDHFDLPQDLFQKELTEIDQLIIQKEKLKKEAVIIGYQQQLSLEPETEVDIIEVPLYSSKEINKVGFEIEKAKVLQGFREVLAPLKKNYELALFQQLLILFKEHGDEPLLRYMIEGISHYYDVLPDWVGEPESDDFVEEFIELVNKYFER
jgi:plasmid maintenance system antidote protein VapI